jgi:hypothetical protein
VRARRLIAAGLVGLACAAVGGTAFAAPVSGGRHFPHFGLMNERVAIKKLPLEMRLLFEGPGRDKGFGMPHPSHGKVWFGEVQRPKSTIAAVAQGHWVCDFEVASGEAGGGGGSCTTLGGAMELGLLDVDSCGKGPPRHFRIHALVPDGVTALEIEKADGTIGRTVPVIENTVAFTVGREDLELHGVGNPAAEALERKLPLTQVGNLERGGPPGCGFYTFTEGKSTG